MEQTFLWIGLLTIAAMLGLVVWGFFRRRESGDESWASFAEERGLSYNRPEGLEDPSISGTCRDVPVHIGLDQDGETTLTVFEVYLPEHVPEGLRMSPEHLGAKMMKLVGAQDVQVGHPELDDAFLIKCARTTDEQHVRDWLGREELADALLALQRSFPRTLVDGHQLEVRVPEFVGSEERLGDVLDAMIEVVHAARGREPAGSSW
jgi:hypothetical protein